jgi:hypothetical protein
MRAQASDGVSGVEPYSGGGKRRAHCYITSTLTGISINVPKSRETEMQTVSESYGEIESVCVSARGSPCTDSVFGVSVPRRSERTEQRRVGAARVGRWH